LKRSDREAFSVGLFGEELEPGREEPLEPLQIFLIKDGSPRLRRVRVSFELTVTASSSWGKLESSPGGKEDIWLPSGESSSLLASEAVSERLGPS